MSPQEQLVLTLTVYGNARDGLPAHQAAGFAREAASAVGEGATAEEAIAAFDEVFRRFRSGG